MSLLEDLELEDDLLGVTGDFDSSGIEILGLNSYLTNPYLSQTAI